MSVAEFSPVLRDQIIRIFSDSNNKVDLANFGSKTRKQLFKEVPDTKGLRKRFESADYHNSSITIDGISTLNARIITSLENTSTKKIVEKFLDSPEFFTGFITHLELANKTQDKISEYGSGDYRLNNISQAVVKNEFISYVKTNLKGVPVETIKMIEDNIQSGHLAGVFFIKLKTALGVKASFSKNSDSTYRDFTVSMDGLTDEKALKALDAILKAVLDADYLTSSLITNSEIFIDATKAVLGNSPSLYTELQFTEDNEASGRLLKQTGVQLNSLISAASRGEINPTSTAINSLISTLKPVVNLILQKAEELKAPLLAQGIYANIVANAEYISNVLIDTPGSLTFKEAIAANLANVIKSGKLLPVSITKIRPKKIKQAHVNKVNISSVVKDFAKASAQLKKSIKQVSDKKFAGTNRGSTVNLTSLQNLINANLQNVISANMGDGSSKDIVNYRTGRFAASASVERMSESRAGMITAFYTYMKNPYQTFEPGYAQGKPASRNPKLLISKSIREIAALKVGSRLRAVSV